MPKHQLIVGPLLGLESETHYTVCFVTPNEIEAASVMVADQRYPATQLSTLYSGKFWRAELVLPAPVKGQALQYQIETNGQATQDTSGNTQWQFYLPAHSESVQLAYASCNGFSDLKSMNTTENPQAMWNTLLGQHASKPFSALLMGGDQVYADSIWTVVPALRDWNALPRAEKIKRKATKVLLDQLDRFYSQLYCDRWNQQPFANALASIPTVMMWDDHDIIDGWGSFPADLQQCEVFQAVYRAAAKHFELFQLRGVAHNKSLIGRTGASTHYSLGIVFRGHTIIALDHRSQRTIEQVMDSQHWADVNEFLDNTKQGDLLLLSAVPVVYRDFSFVENAFDATPWDEELSDDLKDHWRAREHQGERARLIMRLLANARMRKGRTVILSGDVHVGCLGVVKDQTHPETVMIHQVVSSGIVHPAPTHIQWMGILATTNDRSETLDEQGNICADMLKAFGAGTYFRTRNFVTLQQGNDQKLWVNWICENGEKPVYPLS